MKFKFVKVLPILLLVLVEANGSNLVAQLSDDIATSSSSSLTHKIDDLIKEISELKSEIGELKETIQPQIDRTAQSSPTSLIQMQQSSANVSKSERIVPKYYTTCMEAMESGFGSGVYKIQLPFSGLAPFDVYCLKDPENGPTWTVVQRRQDGSVDFYRNWTDYQNGFGDLNGEFFLGLKYLYALTNQLKTQELWIQLADWEGATKTAKYSQFLIGPESSNYTMTQVSGHSGNAGNSLIYHKGKQFSTKDKDTSERNCAQENKGAWWFSTTNSCMHSNLNGEYLRGELTENDYRKGINWWQWRGDYYSYKYSHMAIRPTNYL